ncbi:hypothetical protein SAMN05192558_11487 [Actinokineospora alba]|uniref:Uncharacterized protein n=1 Tax=Actinokineospora alba TaxID=504798 RepID=A0A1H0VJK1_9PSEU|nr:hypothetical protein [Actinokineospora alba]TDP67675.1 hypothetical protein C8E96_3222 [Actinokineospora alba]SDJ28669.1 hypothetical protein SAMN05421871_11287 [Actinokineospora alba]SDP78697.1 hypothetical protein SAMN05192558_11487 [Actinokineospora alba]
MIDTTSWAAVERTLDEALLGLSDDQFAMTLTAPAPPACGSAGRGVCPRRCRSPGVADPSLLEVNAG